MAKPTAPMPKMGSATASKKKAKPAGALPAGDKGVSDLPAPKAHTRTAKPSEEGRIAKGRKLAAAYLSRRDEMELEMATMVVDGMEPTEINTLIEEANTATIEQTKATTTPAPTPAPTPNTGASLAPSTPAADDAPDYLTIPELAAVEEFGGLVVDVATFARTKNEAEAAYKAGKKALIAILDGVKVGRVAVEGIKLARYTGHNSALDAQLLLEAGVDPDVIRRCYRDIPYEDIRITVPRKAKASTGTGTGVGE